MTHEELVINRLHDERVESEAITAAFLAQREQPDDASEVPLPDEPQWGTGEVPLPEDCV